MKYVLLNKWVIKIISHFLQHRQVGIFIQIDNNRLYFIQIDYFSNPHLSIKK